MSVSAILKGLPRKVEAVVKDVQLRRAMGVLESRLRGNCDFDDLLLQSLVAAWANESWSAKVPFLRAILEWFSKTNGPVLECGSGLSTLVLAAAAAQVHRHVLSLEHDSDWASRVAAKLPKRLRGFHSLSIGPLVDYGAFDWYAVPETPDSIGFVVCDGPPGSTRGGRYGLAPNFHRRFAPGCVILLDDTKRSGEAIIVDRWCKELSASVVENGECFTAIRLNHSASLRFQRAGVNEFKPPDR